MTNREQEIKKFNEYFSRQFPSETDKHFKANLRKVWLRLAEKQWK